MSSARNRRIARMQEMGLSASEAAMVDDAAYGAVDVAIEAGAKTLEALPPKLAEVALPAFLGALAGTIMGARNDLAAALARGKSTVQ